MRFELKKKDGTLHLYKQASFGRTKDLGALHQTSIGSLKTKNMLSANYELIDMGFFNNGRKYFITSNRGLKGDLIKVKGTLYNFIKK